MVLTREQALKVSHRVFKVIDAPELGGELRLASLSAGASLAFNSLNARKDKGEDVAREQMLLIIEQAIVDEKDQSLFDAASAAQFLSTVSLNTLTLIMTETFSLMPGAVPSGNSKASPIAA